MKKIAILGKLQTKYKAPFSDSTWEIWSMGKHVDGHLLDRVDKWFDIHKRPVNIDKDTIHREDFPFNECKELVGGNYFCTTSAYLIAYAILSGATEISLYGMKFEIDHARREEEKRNVREMIFFARGKGIKVFDYDGVVTKEYAEPTNDATDFDSDFDS